MPVNHVKALALTQKHRNAFCFGCGQRPADAPADTMWTIWTADMFYCPACAKEEGIGPDMY